MPIATFISGLPGTGKSRKSNQLIQGYLRTQTKFAYLNKDQIRYAHPSWKEGDVRKYEASLLQDAIKVGVHVILDNTYQLRKCTQTDAYFQLKGAKYKIEFIDLNELYENPLLKSFEERGHYIPAPTLCKMYLNYLLNKGKTNLLSGKTVTLVDLDGTLFDTKKKFSRKTGKGTIDWGYVFSREGISTDVFRTEVADMITPGSIVIVVSGRPCTNEVWFATMDKFVEAGFKADYFLFRAAGDRRDDSIVKEEILSLLIKNGLNKEKTVVLDDRKRVIDMREKNGLKVINCSMVENNDF